MLKTYTRADGYHAVVFVANEDTKPEHGLLVSLDYAYYLLEVFQLDPKVALAVQDSLWQKGYIMPSDFLKASVFKDAVSSLKDKNLANEFVQLVRSSLNGD